MSKNIEPLIKTIPSGLEPEDSRAAYSVLVGFREDKSLKEICGYYSISEELGEKWWNYFKLSSNPESVGNKRGRKGKDLNNYIKSNFGKVITPKQLVEEIGISLPTFYNFYNANRHFFKKVSRGQFEIINPENERSVKK